MTDYQEANRCLVQKNYQRAIELFLQHAANCPDEAAQAYASVAECYLRTNVLRAPRAVTTAVTLISQGDRCTAEEYFRLALQADPTNVRALWGLSELVPKLSGERRELLERLVALQPGALSLVALGDLYRTQTKDFEGAYALYKQAQQHRPRDQTAYKRLNDICRRLGRPEEANEWSRRWQEVYARKRRVGG